jgi:hypothetical protein
MSALPPERLDGARRALLSLPGWKPARERSFHARVLARTTRQDPSWRGDLRLWLEFLGRRLESSPALRLVAAVLVLHLVAFPVVALMAWRARAPAPRPLITFELPARSPFADPAPQPEVPSSPELDAARKAESVENEIARARLALARLVAPDLVPAPQPPAPVRWLERRAAGIREHHWEKASLAVGAPLVEQALAVEVWLDEWIWTGGAPPREALARLSAGLAEGRAAPGEELATLAIERARAYGLVAGPPRSGAGLPCSATWKEALERAGSALGLGDLPAWRAWCR